MKKISLVITNLYFRIFNKYNVTFYHEHDKYRNMTKYIYTVYTTYFKDIKAFAIVIVIGAKKYTIPEPLEN